MAPDIKYCRTCYRHLAGETGVRITQQLILKNYISLTENTFEVTKSGEAFFHQFNMDIHLLRSQKRPFSKACLDGSEHEYHLAGLLGNSFFESMLNLHWFQRKKDSRALVITAKGKKGLKNYFEIIV